MTNYIDSTLLPEEKVKYRTNRHWIIFSPTVLWLILTFGAAFFLPRGILEPIPLFFWGYETEELLTLALFAITVMSGIYNYVDYVCSEFGITNKRVLMKVGLIRRFSLEIFLERIESIHVRQGITGRIVGFGTIQVIGTGGTHDYFRYIPEPLEFRQRVQRYISEIYESEHHYENNHGNDGQ